MKGRISNPASSMTLLLAVLFCGFSNAAAAQNRVFRTAAEQGFTVPPNVQTPVVLRTRPDAVCELHAAGDGSSHPLKVYANSEGYLQLQVAMKQESQEDSRVQLDCAAGNERITYPIRLRASSSPTDDMPAPKRVVPVPKGSRLLPALGDEEARQLSEDELLARGYTPRPDPDAEPEGYAVWLKSVSKPIMLVPAQRVSRTDVRASVETTANWSGLEAHASKGHTWMAVEAQWIVPTIYTGEAGQTTYSSFWIGLDGDGLSDLVQEGTEQDYTDIGGNQYGTYYAWTELVPNQTTEAFQFYLNPSDEVGGVVYVGDANGKMNVNGAYAWFSFSDSTSGRGFYFSVPLGGAVFVGTEAEWIMERPKLSSGDLPDLSDYVSAAMFGAYAQRANGSFMSCGRAANRVIKMYNEYYNYPDNNELSTGIWQGKSSSTALFSWFNFH